MVARGGVVCFLEHDVDGVLDASLRALTLARSLSESSGRVLVAAMMGMVPPSDLEALAGYGVSDVFQVVVEGVEGYAPMGWARALLDLVETWGADALVAAGTDRGNEVMAHVGATTWLPVTVYSNNP